MAAGGQFSVEAVEAALRERFGAAIGERRERRGTVELAVGGAAVAEVCKYLKAEWGYDYLVLLSGIDRLTHLEVVYLLSSLVDSAGHGRLWLRVTLDRADPRVPSVSAVWEAANWHERECFDLLGVVFEGHPDLRRIVLPDCWQGHPLRKDYEYTTDTMVDEILEWGLASDQVEHL